MTDRPNDQLPEHERRPETDVGAGVVDAGGTASERGTDGARPVEPPDARQPESDMNDPDPEDPNGPEAAYQPRSI
jgi:hypothetical protein